MFYNEEWITSNKLQLWTDASDHGILDVYCVGAYTGADPENLKGGGPGEIFDYWPRKSANFMPFLRNIPKIFKNL